MRAGFRLGLAPSLDHGWIDSIGLHRWNAEPLVAASVARLAGETRGAAIPRGIGAAGVAAPDADILLPLPAGKAYELWLLPKQGDPIPAGVFKPNAHGEANLVNPPLRAGLEAKGFAITIKPEMGAITPPRPLFWGHDLTSGLQP
jgi:anti-sigma-K factor RskA